MAFQETQALTLRLYDYGDTSQIAHLLTANAGKIHVLAKGSRREKNAFQGSLDLLVHGRAGWYRRARTGLHLLGTFEVLDTFPRIRRELPRYYAACHVLEALHESTRQEDPGDSPFRLGLATLRVIARARDPARVVPIFHADLLRLMGSAPQLSSCVACGRPGTEIRTARLSPGHGGLLCESCDPGDRHILDLAPGVAPVLARLVGSSFREGLRVEIPSKLRGTVSGILATLLRHVLERDLPTLRWLGS